MVTIILFASLVAECPVVRVVTPENYAITLGDVRQFEQSSKECKKRYEKSPCMRQMHIIDTNRYAIKCGKKGD